MAAPRGPRAAAGATLETCLADARGGKPRPVYLLDGDAFLTLRAARALAAELGLLGHDRQRLHLQDEEGAQVRRLERDAYLEGGGIGPARVRAVVVMGQAVTVLVAVAEPPLRPAAQALRRPSARLSAPSYCNGRILCDMLAYRIRHPAVNLCLFRIDLGDDHNVDSSRGDECKR